VPVNSVVASRSARDGLRAAAAFGGLGLTLSGVYALSGLGIPCPWRYLTHTLCPFCGSTTMGAHLLRGDFVAAWSANQFVFLLLIGIAVACVVWTVEVLGGPAVRLPQRLRDLRLWYVLLGIAAVTFAVVRNLIPLG
jgi:hypothetical protein